MIGGLAVSQKIPAGTGWLSSYTQRELVSDALAGTIVAIMFIPQRIAYAMHAGLPPEVELYTIKPSRLLDAATINHCVPPRKPDDKPAPRPRPHPQCCQVSQIRDL